MIGKISTHVSNHNANSFLNTRYRVSNSKRNIKIVFFVKFKTKIASWGSWETYFLLIKISNICETTSVCTILPYENRMKCQLHSENSSS